MPVGLRFVVELLFNTANQIKHSVLYVFCKELSLNTITSSIYQTSCSDILAVEAITSFHPRMYTRNKFVVSPPIQTPARPPRQGGQHPQAAAGEHRGDRLLPSDGESEGGPRGR